jgi:hypothetical protein
MRNLVISILALGAFSGCVALHADIPEDVVRHIAREDGAQVGAICSQDGRGFSEGAVVCMASQRMTCDPGGRWIQDGGC